MSFIDDLYNYYKDLLINDDEDIDIVVAGAMQEFDRNDMLKVLEEASDNHLYDLTFLYITHRLREKIIHDIDDSSGTEYLQ